MISSSREALCNGFGSSIQECGPGAKVEISSDTIEDILYAKSLPLNSKLKKRFCVFSEGKNARGQLELLSVDERQPDDPEGEDFLVHYRRSAEPDGAEGRAQAEGTKGDPMHAVWKRTRHAVPDTRTGLQAGQPGDPFWRLRHFMTRGGPSLSFIMPTSIRGGAAKRFFTTRR